MGLGDSYQLVELKNRKRAIIQNPSASGVYYGDQAWNVKEKPISAVKRAHIKRVIVHDLSDYNLELHRQTGKWRRKGDRMLF